jgi:tRNA-splicing ligase RtcB
MEIFDNQIPVFGQADDRTLNQIRVCARTADKVALMPDNHVGYGVPIGGVVAYKNAISPTGVGYDIGCGNKAVRLDMPGGELRGRIAMIMDDVWSIISFGVGRRNNEKVDHALFDDEAWKLKAISSLKELARNQLGTVGSGNHYVDLFTDEEDRVWIGVHFGSRGLGHKTATHFLKAAGASDGMDVEPCVLSTDSDLGTEYLEAMRLAGDYAYAGRDWVCGRVAQILGAPIVEEAHNHHNYAWREEHEGEQLCARVRRRPFRVREGLLAARWVSSRSFSKESKTSMPAIRSIPPCTARVEHWVVARRQALSIVIPERSSEPARSHRR